MQLSSIVIKYTLIDIVVFDYIPFPIYSSVCFNLRVFRELLALQSR